MNLYLFAPYKVNCNFDQKKMTKNFLLYFSFQFLVITKVKHWIGIWIRNRIHLKCWIRIRIHNTDRQREEFMKEHARLVPGFLPISIPDARNNYLTQSGFWEWFHLDHKFNWSADQSKLFRYTALKYYTTSHSQPHKKYQQIWLRHIKTGSVLVWKWFVMCRLWFLAQIDGFEYGYNGVGWIFWNMKIEQGEFFS